ncbi:MAG: cyclin-dependent kinase inhibitor 3 family protein [Sandaracinaceae bacterium]
MRREPRTSESDPLRVDFIAQEHLAGLPGRLGMTIAPGKKDPYGITAAWNRNLDADLLRLRDEYSTDLIVSLVEDHELDLLKIPGLHARALALGIATLRYPIRDVDVPTDMDHHAEVVNAILAWIQRGKTTVVHCRGGHGRTGLVVATVLVALGHSARDAIAATRAARAGTVEVPAQERWVARYADVVAGRYNVASRRARRDRARPAPRGRT